ncbi:MAG: NAD(P)-dependent oxidoreductase [Myxococcota bacterium]
MPTVLRWGQSAYETDVDMQRERDHAHALGLQWKAHPDTRTRPSETADVLVVTSKVHVTGPVLDTVRPTLVCTTTSGYEHIDLAAARNRNIAVVRCPMARRNAVVEHTLSCLIYLLRDLHSQVTPAHEGRWVRSQLPDFAPRGIAGSTIAVVGLGIIGQQVASTLVHLGANVIGVDPNPTGPSLPMAELDAAIADADAVTLHASATPSAIGMFDAQRLASLPARCVVINTARGDLMDPIAAARAVQSGHLGGLACDVFPEEPWPHLAEYAAPNILLTPHSSGFTQDLGERVAADVQQVLLAWVHGRAQAWRVA